MSFCLSDMPKRGGCRNVSIATYEKRRPKSAAYQTPVISLPFHSLLMLLIRLIGSLDRSALIHWRSRRIQLGPLACRVWIIAAALRRIVMHIRAVRRAVFWVRPTVIHMLLLLCSKRRRQRGRVLRHLRVPAAALRHGR